MDLALSTTVIAAPRNEQVLVHAARQGDDRAFGQLYALYCDRIVAFIFSKVHDHGRAEDISQEVFMSALRQLRGREQEISFKPWIFAIAKNACIDEFRRTTRGREVCLESDADLPTDHRASLSLVPSPPAAIESKQRLQDLRGAFEGLSESHHRLLMMREFEGRSYDEIGERLGMTRQMVESGLFRARRKLSEEYDELASGRRCEQVQTVIGTGATRRLKALGIKERRRLTQHLSHCQACRHQAHMAGVDETLLKPRSLGAKIAALLPFGGLWRSPWRRGGSAAGRAQAATGHAAASGALQGAAQAAGTAGSSISIGQAAAAAAALTIAGAGGGIAIARGSHHQAQRPAAVTHPARIHHRTLAASASLAPAGYSGSAADASAARSAAVARPGARTTAERSLAGQRTLGARHVSDRHGRRAPRGRRAPTAPIGGQTTRTRSSASGSSTTTTSGTTLSSSGSQTRNLLGNTIDRTIDKIAAPARKIPDVKRAADPVLSSAPVEQISEPVHKAPSPASSASSSGSPDPGSSARADSAPGSQEPVGAAELTSGL